MKSVIFLLLSLISWLVGISFLIVLLAIVFIQKVSMGFIIFILFLISICGAIGVFFWKSRHRATQGNINPISNSNFTKTTENQPISKNTINNNNINGSSFTASSDRVDPDDKPFYIDNSLLSYLEAKILKFWDGKRTDYVIPPYYSESAFGRNVKPVLEKLLSEGFIECSSLDKNISLHTIAELKVILADHELKTSGKKQELIYRLLENLSPVELEELFPVGVYQLTEKGQRALDEYSLMFLNDDYSLHFSFYRLKGEKKKSPQLSDKEILLKLALEDMEKAAKRSLYDNYLGIATAVGNMCLYKEDYRKALDFYIAAFFAWRVHLSQFKTPENVTNPYLSMQIDKCGALCNMSLNDLCHTIYTTIVSNNLLGLGTIDNAQKTVKEFKRSISLT